MPNQYTHWLSIVIPMLNEADSIAATLNALAPWRKAGAEVIVVDGGSKDNSIDIAKPLCDQVVQAERGRAFQMNKGAAHARGRYVMFLHADTRFVNPEPFHFKATLERSNPAWGRFDVSITGNSAWLAVVAYMMNMRSRLTGIATGDQAIFIHHTLFEHLRGFKQQPLMEDVELCRRLKRVRTTGSLRGGLALGAPLFCRERVLTSGRRWEANGVWRTIVLMWRMRWLYWRGVSPEQLASIYQAMRRG